MVLNDLYPQLRYAHIGLVLASGSLFLVRCTASLRGASWPLSPLARMSSYGIDIALLSVALVLLHILQLNPFAVAWLGTKLALLLLYIVLGSFALKRAKTRAGRLGFLAASMLCYAYMLTVARAHSPWGLFAFWP